jgi:hypothetical protein
VDDARARATTDLLCMWGTWRGRIIGCGGGRGRARRVEGKSWLEGQSDDTSIEGRRGRELNL